LQKTERKKRPISLNHSIFRFLPFNKSLAMTSPVELIWLDNSASPHVQTRLRDIAPNLNVFTNSDACIDHIISACSTPDSVFLIVSGSLGQQVAAVIDALPQIRAVYVFCFDTSKHIPWATQYNKIGADRMFSQENNLITRLTADLKEAAAKVCILVI
jgi:hypothetical protein